MSVLPQVRNARHTATIGRHRARRPLWHAAIGALLVLVGTATAEEVVEEGVEEGQFKNYDQALYSRLSTDRKTLYEQLGGREVIAAFVADGVDNSVADPRIGFFFEHTDLPMLKHQLTEQICQLTGGPCVYEGMDMQTAHSGLNIGEKHFVALVEAFQQAMRKHRIPYAQENKVLALLAPMKPAVIHQ